MNKTEAIKNFLSHRTHKDLADLYSYEMEVQVVVAQDHGERVEGEYRGRKWLGFTDGIHTWKSFRIPWNPMSDPEYRDNPIQFDLAEHAEGIGLTGWNWVKKRSIYVAYDFDALIGHKKGLSQDELNEITNVVKDIDYVTLRRSTSGSGLHIYIFLDQDKFDEEIKNHNEHAALSRAILSKLCSETGIDLSTKVDAMGGNFWIWHRKMEKTSEGLQLLKEGSQLSNVPLNWRDHVDVVTKKRKLIRPILKDDDFDSLVARGNKISLDDEHIKLIKWLEENEAQSWFDTDHHMLIAHTYDLQRAHEELNLKGLFQTVATGKNQGADHNCFAFPLKNGSWVIRRYSKGVNEAPSWDQDGHGWTVCYYNREPDLDTACRYYGGVEHPNGYYIFREASVATQALSLLGIYLDLPSLVYSRETRVKRNKDGRIVVEVKYEPTDDGGKMAEWVLDGKYWKRVLRFKPQFHSNSDLEIGEFDDVVRHLITDTGEDYGWVIKANEEWHIEPLTHIKLGLKSLGFKGAEVDAITGGNVLRCWTLVNRPFEPEYLGNRQWNRNSPQLKYTPKESIENLHFPTWTMILDHVGEGLNQAVKDCEWCQSVGIQKGSEYLKCWIASMIQYPHEPLPYLFFYGDQNTGKSIFHESLSMLITSGYVNAGTALISNNDYNAELENCILAYVEEKNLTLNKEAYSKIKEWTTSLQLPIHRKHKTPYSISNTTHWVHCSNHINSCPVFSGDSRIVVIHVPKLDKPIAKRLLLEALEKEAQDFTTEIVNLEIPECNDRLMLPVIETEDKRISQKIQETELDTFLDEECYYYPGSYVTFSEFVSRFHAWLDSSSINYWTKARVSKTLPTHTFPKGRIAALQGGIAIGNLSFTEPEHDVSNDTPYVLVNEYLKLRGTH